MTMPDTSTMAAKQDFAAFSTVTAAPLGPSLGASGSSAARAGVVRVRQSKAAREIREGVGAAKGGIGIPVRFSGTSIAEGRRGSQVDFESGIEKNHCIG